MKVKFFAAVMERLIWRGPVGDGDKKFPDRLSIFLLCLAGWSRTSSWGWLEGEAFFKPDRDVGLHLLYLGSGRDMNGRSFVVHVRFMRGD
jgi:hypothetical protein